MQTSFADSFSAGERKAHAPLTAWQIALAGRRAMFTSIDHIVVVVGELEAAIRAYGELGFTVVRGGRHNIGTHNALVAFADGSYIELIAFLHPVPEHPWYKILARGGGIADFCMATNDLRADVDAMRAAGVSIGDPSAMTRDRPDGYRLKWVLSIPAPPFNGSVPFLIKDETPRDERVARERMHRNGVLGLRRLTVALPDPFKAAAWYRAATGSEAVPISRPELDAAGVRFIIGPHELDLVSPASSGNEMAAFIRERGAMPYEAVLEGPGAMELDRVLTQNARLSIA